MCDSVCAISFSSFYSFDFSIIIVKFGSFFLFFNGFRPLKFRLFVIISLLYFSLYFNLIKRNRPHFRELATVPRYFFNVFFTTTPPLSFELIIKRKTVIVYLGILGARSRKQGTILNMSSSVLHFP